MDAIKELSALRDELLAIANHVTAKQSGAIHEVVDKLNALMVPASLTMEALNPIFDLEHDNRGLRLIDIAYNAFMIGRRGENRENGHRCDWFNDTEPLILAGIDKIQRQCAERIQYAADFEARQKARMG